MLYQGKFLVFSCSNGNKKKSNYNQFTWSGPRTFRHIHNKLVDKAVPFSKLQSEIDADRPIEVVYFWRDWEKPGHSIIVRGWRIDGEEEFVHVNDPANSSTTMSGIIAYSELLAPYGEGDWTYTWIEIRR